MESPGSAQEQKNASRVYHDLRGDTRSCQCWQISYIRQQNFSLIKYRFWCSSKCFRQVRQTMAVLNGCSHNPALLTSKALDEAIVLQEYLQLCLIRWEASLQSNTRIHQGSSFSSCTSCLSGKVFNLILFNSGYSEKLSKTGRQAVKSLQFLFQLRLSWK